MARYRITFSRDWIRGRWGFIDRKITRMGGRETEPSRTENAWFLEFKGDAPALGRYMTELLELRQIDLQQFGSIFEITPMDSEKSRRRPQRKALPEFTRNGPVR